MWKILHESVEGTSHRRTGTPCQDSAFCTVFCFPSDEGIIIACADGAGSASSSQVGSKLACEEIVKLAHLHLEGGGGVESLSREILVQWYAGVHAALVAEAEKLATTPRELACTLLVAVVGKTRAIFGQIGDGVIVIYEGGAYRTVFWPASGEYQNTTYFISDPAYQANVRCEILEQAVEELAVMSDGLQMLALNYALQAAHQPFFHPIFKSLRLAEDHQELQIPMRQFLDSDVVNARTDDDKTLILATRMAADVAHTP